MLGFVTQHSIDIPLICISESGEVRVLAKEIMNLLNVEKLKKHALAILMKDDSSEVKLQLALRALRFIKKPELDEDILYLLAQFIDHYSLVLRYEAIFSLYYVLKSSRPVESVQIRKILAVAPHVLRDRLKLLKYDTDLRIVSVKCLTVLWIALDKGRLDTHAYSMHHVLVKEHRSSSFIVGSASSVTGILRDLVNKTQLEREAAWKCLRKMLPVFEELDQNEAGFFIEEMKKGLISKSRVELQLILKLLTEIPVPPEDRSEFVLILLSPELAFAPAEIDLVSALLAQWKEVMSLKCIVCSNLESSSGLGDLLFKLFSLIEGSSRLVGQSSFSLSEHKHLTNWYKSLINQVAESVQWPSNVYPHCNQLLDISSDPSLFMREESLPEFSGAIDIDYCAPKVSIESANSDQDEAPPSMLLCLQLIRAGVRSDGLKYWVLWYLKNTRSIVAHVAQ